MNTQPTITFDPTSDIYQIGLAAAASPDFADALIRALIAEGADSSCPEAPAIHATRVPA